MGAGIPGPPAIGDCWAMSVEAVMAVPRIAVVKAEDGRRKPRLLAGWGGSAGDSAGGPKTLPFRSLRGPHGSAPRPQTAPVPGGGQDRSRWRRSRGQDLLDVI